MVKVCDWESPLEKLNTLILKEHPHSLKSLFGNVIFFQNQGFKHADEIVCWKKTQWEAWNELVNSSLIYDIEINYEHFVILYSKLITKYLTKKVAV